MHDHVSVCLFFKIMYIYGRVLMNANHIEACIPRKLATWSSNH